MEDSDESTARTFIVVHVGTWILFVAGIVAFALFFDRMNTLAKFIGAVLLGVLMPSFRDLRIVFRSRAQVAAHAREKQRRIAQCFTKGPPRP